MQQKQEQKLDKNPRGALRPPGVLCPPRAPSLEVPTRRPRHRAASAPPGCHSPTITHGARGLTAPPLVERGSLFYTGTAIFAVGAILNFVSFSFAPTAVLAPLESIQ